MKKQIVIPLGALNFLHRVLTETGVVTKQDARKQHTVFKAMEKTLTDFHNRLNAVRATYRESSPMKDNNGNVNPRWIVPEEKQAEYQEKLNEIENEETTVTFDVESFSVLNSAFDALFAKQAKLVEEGQSGGMSNELTMKLIEEASAALEKATDVE